MCHYSHALRRYRRAPSPAGLSALLFATAAIYRRPSHGLSLPLTAIRRTLSPPSASAGRCSVQSRPPLPKGSREPFAHRCGDMPRPCAAAISPRTFVGRAVGLAATTAPPCHRGHISPTIAQPFPATDRDPPDTSAARRVGRAVGLAARHRADAPPQPCTAGHRTLRFPPPMTVTRRTLLLGTFARRALWALRQAFRPALRWAYSPGRIRAYLKARANPSLTAAAMRPAPSSAGLSALLPVAAARASSRCRFASATRFSSARTKRR